MDFAVQTRGDWDLVLGTARWAEERGLDIYFENHNKEPDESEMHYIPRDVAETLTALAAYAQGASAGAAHNAARALADGARGTQPALADRGARQAQVGYRPPSHIGRCGVKQSY